MPLRDRVVVVGVCGGIAAYKVVEVVSRLSQLGAKVKVAMTPEGAKFVGPLTFQAISGHPVLTDVLESPAGQVGHVLLTEGADLMLVAPATANTLAKIACGLCDEPVSLLVCAADCPVVFAPAMNPRMWANPITQENVAKLAKAGYEFIGPEEGWMACRSTGKGRLSEASAIVEWVKTRLASSPKRAS